MKVIDVGITLDSVTDGGNITTNSITIGSLTSTGNASFDLDSGANSFSILDTGANLIFDAKGTLDDSSLFISLGDLDDFSGGAYVEISGSADKVKVKKQLQLLDYTGAGTYTGTAVKALSVDASGNVIETDITSTPTLQTVTTAGNETTASIDTADISIINQNGTNPSDAGSLYFIESGTTWGTNVAGFRLINDGNLNTLKVQSNLNTVVTDVLALERDGNIGIGTTTPTAKLNVIGAGNSSATKALLIENSDGDDLVKVQDDGTFFMSKGSSGATPISQQMLIVEDNTATGIGILTPNSTTGYLFFGDEDDAQTGYISYGHSTEKMSLKVSGSHRLEILSTGQLVLNDYGSGTYTGTSAKTLAVDASGNVIETDGGAVSGGTEDYITRWEDATTLTTSSMYELNEKIGIGTGAVEPSEALEVIGNVEAEEFIGDLRGAVLFKAQAGEAISKGQVVYISGISGNTTVVSLADADDAAKMPAFGIAAEAASLNNPVNIYTFGTLPNIDTQTPGWSLGDELYVNTVAGGLVNSAPSGESSLIQKVGKVTRVDNSAGSIKVMGAGRSNATPNLNTGRLFVGNSSNQAVADDTVYIDIANTRVGINNIPTDSTFHIKSTGTTGASNSIKIVNSDDTARMFYNDAGRLLLETSNSTPFVINRIGSQGLLDFQNNSNEGAIGYFGNATRRFSTGVIQQDSSTFHWAIGQGSSTFDGTTRVLTALQDQSIRFDQYGAGNYTGTVTKFLGVDSSGNIIEEDGVGTPSEAFYAYDNTGGQTVTAANTVLNIDTEAFNSSATVYNLASDVITVNADIRGCITFYASFTTPGSTRTTVEVKLQESTNGGSVWNDVPGGKIYAYVRQGTTNDDSTAGSATIIREITSGYKYRLVGDSIAGSVTTVAGATGISIYDLKGGQQGPSGSDGGGDTYTLTAAQSTNDVDITLDAATGADSTVKLVAGDNITLTEASDEITIDAASGVTVTGSPSANYLAKFSTTSTITDSVIRESSGNIGIGVISPANKLEVDGTILSNSIIVADSINHDGNTITGIDFGTNTIQLRTNASEKLSINNTGVITLNSYGSGNNTGTQTVNLEADSTGDIIERKEERGTFSGTTNFLGQLTINHSLGSTPTFVMITLDMPGSDSDAVGVVSKSSSNIVIEASRSTSQSLSGYYLVSL